MCTLTFVPNLGVKSNINLLTNSVRLYKYTVVYEHRDPCVGRPPYGFRMYKIINKVIQLKLK